MYSEELSVTEPRVIVVSEKNFKSLCENNELNDQTVEYCKSTAFISIVDPHRIDQRYFSQEHSNVLNLAFSDMTDKEMLGYTRDFVEQGFEPKLFGIDEAERIVKFVKRNYNNGVRHWIVHCHAGISRSGAVGLFINNLLEYEWDKFKNDNPIVRPNFYIVHLLNIASGQIGGRQIVEINETDKYKFRFPIIMTVYNDNEHSFIGRCKRFQLTSYGISLEDLTINIKANLDILIDEFSKEDNNLFSDEWIRIKEELLYNII